jgi:organic radical activating enzyme
MALFPTVQGEPANPGRVAVPNRFAGCDLWCGCENDGSSRFAVLTGGEPLLQAADRPNAW